MKIAEERDKSTSTRTITQAYEQRKRIEARLEEAVKEDLENGKPEALKLEL
jgi:hypothetical protein